MSEAVSLRVNGVDYGGWKEVDITAGIERLARDFNLSITRRWPGEKEIPKRVRPGDVCEVYIGTDKVLTGYVDATPVRYDSSSMSVGVKGRSKTADLGDCAADYKTGQWRGAKIERIAADLAKPYGIEVAVQESTGDAVAEHQIQPGESAFECIDRLLTLRQLLATDDSDGRVVFINAGSGGRAGTSLVLGENILSADCQLDYKDVFGSYTVKGQRSGDDNDHGSTVAESSSTARDTEITRHRALVIRQSGQASSAICADRARYEMLNRKAKALETSYTVQGWRQQDGKLWVPNQMVHVKDPVIGFDVWMLIVEVNYRISEAGTVATLKVGPLDGYIPTPQAVKRAKAKKAAGIADDENLTWVQVR